MADNVVKIFEINTAPVVEQLSALGAQLDSAKKAYSELKAKQGEYSEDAIRAKSNVNALSKEYNSIKTVLDNNTKALYALDKTTQENLKTRNLENNSIDTNRKLYNSLYNEIIKQQNPTKEQIKLAKELSDTLKKQEAILGDTRRNVGNYAEGFKSAFDAVKEGVPGLKAFEKGQQGVNMALSANPIGAVVTLLIALKEIFGQNAKVADQLTFVFDGLTKGFNFVIDTIVETVSSFDNLGKALAHPIDFLSKLGSGAMSAAKDGYEASQAYDDLIVTSAKYGAEIEANNVRIEEQTTVYRNSKLANKERLAAAQEVIALEQQNAKKNEEIAVKEKEAFAQKYKNSTLSNELQAKQIELEKAVNTARVNGISSVRRATLEIDKLFAEEAKTRQDEAKKAQDEAKKITDDQLKKMEAYNKSLQSLSDEFTLTERQKLKKSFDDKIATVKGNSDEEIKVIKAIRVKQTEALLKFDEDAQKKVEAQKKKFRDEDLKRATDSINTEIELNRQKYELDLQAVDLSVASEQDKSDRKKAIQLQYLQEQIDLTVKLANVDNVLTQQELNNIQKLQNALDILKKGGGEKKVNLIKELGIDEKAVGEATQTLQKIGEIVATIGNTINEVYNRRISDIESEKDAQLNAVDEKTARELEAVEQSNLSEADKAERKSKIEKKAADEKKALEKAAAQQAYKVQVEQFNVNKAIQIVQATIATALAVVQGLMAGLSAGGPAGIALGPITAAAAGIAGAVQIALIASQKPPPPPKFKDGVIGLNGAGSDTSDSITAQLSAGESVITARATQAYAPLLASLEESVGNKPNFQLRNRRFATGFIPTTDGGYANRSLSSSAMMSVDAITKAMANVPAPKLVLAELDSFTTTRDRSVTISEL